MNLLIVAFLLAQVALPTPTFDGLPKEESEACASFTSNTTKSFFETATSPNEFCRVYSFGYMEGLFDAGVGYHFAVPKESVSMGTLHNSFVVFYQDGRFKPDAEARLAITYMYIKLFGEVSDGQEDPETGTEGRGPVRGD